MITDICDEPRRFGCSCSHMLTLSLFSSFDLVDRSAGRLLDHNCLFAEYLHTHKMPITPSEFHCDCCRRHRHLKFDAFLNTHVLCVRIYKNININVMPTFSMLLCFLFLSFILCFLLMCVSVCVCSHIFFSSQINIFDVYYKCVLIEHMVLCVLWCVLLCAKAVAIGASVLLPNADVSLTDWLTHFHTRRWLFVRVNWFD